MTDERRVELQLYKSLAVDLESRLRVNRKSKQSNSIESEIIEKNEVFVTEQGDEFSYSSEKSGNDVVGDFVAERKDDDNVPMADEIYISGEKFSIENTKFEANDSPRSLHLDINSITAPISNMLSPSFSLHSSPSLGALNDTKNQTLYLTPYSVRDSPEADFNSRKLIRSNSYTLETPSPMLLKLMEANGINANESVPSKTIASSQPSLATKEKMPAVKQAWAGSASKIAVKKSPSLSDVKTTKVVTARKSISPASSVREQRKRDLCKPKAGLLQRRTASARNQESVLRSIYDSGLNSRFTTKPKKLSATSPSASGKLTARIENVAPKPVAATEPNAVDFQKVLKMIEEQHNAQMNSLIERQREEQKRMHEEFARQQEMLVKQISNLVLPAPNNVDDCVPPNLSKPKTRNDSLGSTKNEKSGGGYDSADTDDISANVTRDHNGNQLNRSRIHRKQPTPESLKCMRRLVYYDDNQMVSEDLSDSSKQQQRHPDIPLTTSNEAELFRIQNEAATIITAYAKGFLTRRLFRTMKIQNIVKTIKDTLLFILDIHFENPIANDSPADLKLKTHLIQQVRTQYHIKSMKIFKILFGLPIFPLL